MSIFAIADLHLSFAPGSDKPMDIFGLHWKDHFQRISADWTARVSEADRRRGVGAYAMDEQALPRRMEACGFREVTSTCVALSFTPDSADCPRETALAIFEAGRRNDLDAAEFLLNEAGDLVTPAEIGELKRLIDARYDRRVALYEAGERQWDTTVALTQIVRGTKP